MLLSPAPSPLEPPPLNKMVATTLARALGTKAKGCALAGSLIVHAAFGMLRIGDDALEERWANEQLKAVFKVTLMVNLTTGVVILAILNVSAETVEAEMRVMYDSTLPMSILTTMIVTIGYSLCFDFFKDPVFARRSRAMGWVG